jgi:putative FmdB family regulatory protein
VPLYEYQCPKCGHRFERIQKFSDPDPKKCPECGAGKLERLLHAPAVQFKGSGWYVTDYGKAGSSSKSAESKPSESSGSKSDDKTKSDSAKSSSEKKKQ